MFRFLRFPFVVVLMLLLGSSASRLPRSVAYCNPAPSVPGKIPDIPIAKGYFINPLDVPMSLVGNFGEPRKSHFHMGLDFRTNQEEGHKVFAAADGYVSRINVSGGGYGNALYITHPNGFVTVYAHLKEFGAAITERLRKEQYQRESFSVDFNLPPGEIAVKQGQVVALSGNTGGSGGPHLHFEIRDTFERVYNPMLFDYNLKDDLKPVVGFIKFYPMDSLRYKCDGYRTRFAGRNGVYEAPALIRVNAAQVSFSVNTYDLINGSEAKIGIYNMTVFDGNKMIYDYRMDRLLFEEKRYVMSHVDYPVFVNEGRKGFHKCFVEPGNQCGVYSNLVNAGIVDLSDRKDHPILIEVSDFSGNVALVRFKLRYDKTAVLFTAGKLSYTTLLSPNKPNEFTSADIKISMPERCLFDQVYFSYSATTTADTANIFSKVHQVHRSDTYLNDWFDISLRTERLPQQIADKAVIVWKDRSGAAAAKGGTYRSGWLSARSREFGTYYVKLDTTPPVLTPLNVSEGKNMSAYKKLIFKVTDDLSGFSDFDTWLDDKWVVSEFDAKSATIICILPADIEPGPHHFRIAASDERGNQRQLKIGFGWH